MQNIEDNIKKTFQNLGYLDKDSFRFIATEEATNITDSKIGGTPYIPKDASLPQNAKGQDLRLIAQINLEELEGDIFPIKRGVIQFWALPDTMYGQDMQKPIAQDNSRIVYYPSIEACYTKEELEAKYSSLTEEVGEFPFNLADCFKLEAREEKCFLPIADFHFNEIFLEEYKKHDPSCDYSSFWDLLEDDEDEEIEEIFNDRRISGHKLLGYPDFAQEDPRKNSKYEDYILLLQIDSDRIGNKSIYWGDNGVANWFIHPEDLKNKDFSKVLYTWDCA